MADRADSDREEKPASPITVNEHVLASNDAVRRRLVRKTDFLMIPGMGEFRCLTGRCCYLRPTAPANYDAAFAYFTNTLDRANLGNAKTDGIEKDLGLAVNQFSLLLVLFYIPYALFSIPWTIAAKRFNPSVIIPIAIAVWGACTLGAAGAKNFGQIMAIRVIMGAVEAAYKPCEVYYLSVFYTRREIGLRVSFIGQMGFIAGAVSGLISYSVFQWTGGLHVSETSAIALPPRCSPASALSGR